MQDHLLYLFSTIASLSVVLAFALVVDVRTEARQWGRSGVPHALRIVRGATHIVELVAVGTGFTVSLTQLLVNANDQGMAALAATAVSIAFGMLAIGVVAGPLVVLFMRKPSDATVV